MEKNRLERGENTFFLNTLIMGQKMGENTREKFFSRNRFRKQTTLEKNRLEKVRKHVFYKHTNIVTKKSWEKTREKNFPETHVYREL